MSHNQGALNAKNKAAGSTVKMNVAMLRGCAFVFRHRPDKKKSMFPAKYS